MAVTPSKLRIILKWWTAKTTALSSLFNAEWGAPRILSRHHTALISLSNYYIKVKYWFVLSPQVWGFLVIFKHRISKILRGVITKELKLQSKLFFIQYWVRIKSLSHSDDSQWVTPANKCRITILMPAKKVSESERELLSSRYSRYNQC